ncbi:MAG: hypothetical protein HRT44_11450, partial [Bdellovibrionales bacterium]|nr:hypothetical protein [Bdellovibrionales bacterium]
MKWEPQCKKRIAQKMDQKNYEKVSEEFIDTESALVRDYQLRPKELIPFDKKMIINR